MNQPQQFCPGARSPFGHHTFRRCTAECGCYRYGATDLVPAMRLNLDTGKRECVNMVPRGGAA